MEPGEMMTLLDIRNLERGMTVMYLGRVVGHTEKVELSYERSKQDTR
jgi:hypothetical protein